MCEGHGPWNGGKPGQERLHPVAVPPPAQGQNPNVPRVVSVTIDPVNADCCLITYSEPVAPWLAPGKAPYPPLNVQGCVIADFEEDGPTRIRCYMDVPGLPPNAPVGLNGRRWSYAGGSQAVVTANGGIPFAGASGQFPP